MMYAAFFSYIFKASALLFLFWALYKTALSRETFFSHNRRFLILGALVALLLPLWNIERVEVIRVALTTAQYSEIPLPPPSDDASSGLKTEGVLFFTYLTGVIIFTLKLFLQFASLYRIISKADERRKFKKLHLIYSEEVEAPFSFFNYIVLPGGLKEQEDTSVILAHEGVHARQKHSFDILFMHLLTLFMWINPIAWLYRKEVAQNLEYLADHEVSNNTVPTRKYQYILLKQHLSPKQLSIINPFINSLIKKRIVMLHQQPSKPTKLWKFTIAIPALIAFVLLFNVKTVAQYQYVETAKGPHPEEESVFLLPQETIDFVITRDMNKGQLEAVKAAVAAKGGSLKWKKLKHDDQGIITRITVEFSFKNSQASATYEDSNGIQDIYMGVQDNGNVYISSGEKIHMEKEFVWVQKDGESQKYTDKEVIVVTTADSTAKGKHHTRYVIKGDTGDATTWVTSSDTGMGARFIVLEETVEGDMDSDGKLHQKVRVKLQELNEEDSTGHKSFVITKLPAVQRTSKEKAGVSESFHVLPVTGETPIFIVNGKEVSEADLKDMDPAILARIEVLKGEKATAIAPVKGKNGVIMITTKEAGDKVQRSPNSIPPPAPPTINEIDFDNTAVLIDGNKATEKELKALSPDDIDNMEVIKGKEAEEKYGKPAAILITTKK